MKNYKMKNEKYRLPFIAKIIANDTNMYFSFFTFHFII